MPAEDLGPAAAGLCSWLEAALSADRAAVMVHLERRHAALISTLVSQLRGADATERHEASHSRLEDFVQNSIAQSDEQALIGWLGKSGQPMLDPPKEPGAAVRSAQPVTQQESMLSMMGRALAPVEYSLNALLGKLEDSNAGRNSAPAVTMSKVATSGHQVRVPQEPYAGLPDQNGIPATGIFASEDSIRSYQQIRDLSAERPLPQERRAESRGRRPASPLLDQVALVQLRQGANPSDVSMRLNPQRSASTAQAPRGTFDRPRS